MAKTTKPKPVSDNLARSVDTFELIDLSLLVDDPNNVRDNIGDVSDLAESIFQNGLQQPLRVRFMQIDEFGTWAYRLIAGHRRKAAITLLFDQGRWAGEVPCMVAPADVSEDDITAAMLVENLQRADLNPIEEGRAFHRLTKEFGYKQADLALKIGRSASYVSDRMALLRLPDKVVDAVSDSFIPLKIGVALSKVPSDDVIIALTKGGRVVPTEEQITKAIEKAKYEKVKASFAPVIEATGLKVADGEDRFGSAYNTEILATCETPADLEREATTAPRNALLFVEDQPYAGRYFVQIRRKLTEKQLAKQKAEQEARDAERRAKWDAEQQARYEAERASWTPEYKAWVDEVEEIKAHNRAETQRVDEAHKELLGKYIADADAKKVARFAFLFIVNQLGDDWHVCNRIALRLGLEIPDDVEAFTVLTDYATDSAQNLARVVLATIVEYDDDINSALAKDIEAYMHRAGVPAPDMRPLPPEPPKTADAVPTEDDDDFNQEDPDAADDHAA